MNIVIKPENKDRIQAELDRVQHRCTARCLSAYEVIHIATDLYAAYPIAKSHLAGVTAKVNLHAQSFPNAYKYTPESTIVEVRFTKSGCNLVDVYRGTCTTTRCVCRLTDEAKDALVKYYERPKIY